MKKNFGKVQKRKAEARELEELIRKEQQAAKAQRKSNS